MTSEESARAQQLLLQERAGRLSQSEALSELQQRLAGAEGRGTYVQAAASSLQVRDIHRSLQVPEVQSAMGLFKTCMAPSERPAA